MIAFHAMGTLIIVGLIFWGLDSLIDWMFGISYKHYVDYYFDEIFISGPMWFRLFKLWLLGIPAAYFNNIKVYGWKITGY